MEKLREKAYSYAEENVIKVLKEAFAKVYADGYRNGFKDREEEIPVNLRDNMTEYVDLGLPSGTLWSTDYEKDGNNIVYLPHAQASTFELPSIDQWNELMSACKWEYKVGTFGDNITKAICIGPNGKTICFDVTGKIHFDSIKDDYCVFLWLKGESNNNNNKCAIIHRVLQNTHEVNGKKNKYYCDVNIITELFSGYKLPIRLVRNK